MHALYKIGRSMIDLYLDGYPTPPHAIALDIDDTNDMVHGGQQLAPFNTHAGGHCFQPIHIFEANSGKPILSPLREGKRPSGKEIARVLRHVIHRIRRRSPKVRILIRGDGHYCAPEALDLLHHLHCDYILGLPRKPTLDGLAKPWREQCQYRWGPPSPRCVASISSNMRPTPGRSRRRSSHASRPQRAVPMPASS